MEVKEKVMEIIAGQFKRAPGEMNPEDDLAKVYGAKSHDLIQLSATLQMTFGIKISYIQSRQAKTVADWIRLTEGLTN